MKGGSVRYTLLVLTAIVATAAVSWLAVHLLQRAPSPGEGSLWPGTAAWAESYLSRMDDAAKVDQVVVGGIVSQEEHRSVQPFRIRAGFAPEQLPALALAAAGDSLLARSWGALIREEARESGQNTFVLPLALSSVGDSCEPGTLTPAIARHVVPALEVVRGLTVVEAVACQGPGFQIDSLADAALQGIVRSGIDGVVIPDSLLGDRPRFLNLGRRTVPLSIRWFRTAYGYEGLAVATPEYARGAERAIRAGADLVVVPGRPDSARKALLTAVRDGRISGRRLDDAVRRVLRAKKWMGLVGTDQPPKAERPFLSPARMARHLHRSLASGSLTLVQNRSGAVPLTGLRRVLVVHVSDGNDAAERSRFSLAMVRERIGVSLTHRMLSIKAEPEARNRIVNQARRYDAVVVADFASGTYATASMAAFVSDLRKATARFVYLGFEPSDSTPLFTSADAVLLTWTGNDDAMEAAAEALFGRIRIAGRLPITLGPGMEAGRGFTLEPSAPRRGAPEDVGMISSVLDGVDSLIYAAIHRKAFPGAAVAIGRAGTIVKLRAYGTFVYDGSTRVTTRSRFDLASLTKVVATTAAAMELFEQGRLNLDATVASYLPEFGSRGKDRITIRQILSHSAGLPPALAVSTAGISTRDEIVARILGDTLIYRPGTDYVYSDEGMIVLGMVVERITGASLADYTRERIFNPLRMYDTAFRENGLTDTTFVPTEVDSTFRRRLIQGEVHDETAYLMGGIAGHAGLFSTAEDMAKFGYMLVNEGRVYGRQFLKPETIDLFTRRVDPSGRHSRSLGWDTRNLVGYSSAGTLFGPRSYGHTGFTGTSLWVDPDAGIFVVLLSNRVYPTRENDRHVAVRAALADIAYQAIRGPAMPLVFR